ncbi:uncharacterized protein isoform X3 [Musca autumnalis]|uniref:uncharacterized protein isoform X3 n=1 Tax=Musca autumnalis TaxID=221902 RepID=UPI003CE7919E
MEHLDLAGIMTTPPQWNTPVFDQQDAIYLSSSRQMLEPIMEETSEDEEYAYNSWNQYDSQLSDSGGGGCGGDGDDDDGCIEGEESLCSAANGGRNNSSFYSSAESDTGSVIRVEITKDNDSNSERDILCPAKRARRCEDPTNEDEVVLRRPLYGGDNKNNSLERFLNYENFSRDSWGNGAQSGTQQQLSLPQRNSLGNRRSGGVGGAGGFDDFYSDSDSLSYNSLSRSSSLIQFESLERQLMLQEQHASMNSLGNSSPSLLSFDMSPNANEGDSSNRNSLSSANNSGNNSRRGSQSSLLKKYESLDGRLHQTYYDLDKLNFDDMESSGNGESFVRSGLKLAELRSDSESSSSDGSDAGSSRPPSVLSPGDLVEKFQRSNSKKGKSSAENLSEDSGYCEPFGGGLLRRSKSQNVCKNYEKFSEEDEELMEHKSLQQQQQQQHEQNHFSLPMRGEVHDEEAAMEAVECEEKANKQHSIKEFKNNTSIYATPPTSPLLVDYMRHQQRSQTHSPSPVSSEVSSTSSKNSATSSASSSATANSCSSSSSSSSSSATTCASRASFTWLMPVVRTSTASLSPPPPPTRRAYDCQENMLRISLNDLRERKTSNGKQEENAGNQAEHDENNKNVYGDDDDVLINESAKLAAENNVYTQPAHDRGGEDLSQRWPQRSPPQSDDVNEPKNFCFSAIENLCEKNYLKEDPVSSSPGLENHQKLLLKIKEQEKYFQLSEDAASSVNFESEVKSSPLSFYTFETDYSPARQLGVETPRSNFESEIKSPLSYYTSESDYSPACGRRQSFLNLMQNWPERTSSVPNELNKLGRKKKYKKSRPKFTSTQIYSTNNNTNESSSTDSEELEEVGSPLKRSNSWCFESSISTTTTTTAFRPQVPHLARLHQSYHNLSLLGEDLLAEEAEQRMAEKRISSDYETDLVCKNNFLLDELSAHYDKTASILNDRPPSKDREYPKPSDTVDCASAPEKPKPPSRRRKTSNSSHSETEASDGESCQQEVHHVQLVIRKPPARQKRQEHHDKEKANSLTQDYNSFTAFMQGGSKTTTFDQDPTMLRTSYAQSLEKCNFDCREISNTDLTRTRTMPKRRFHSQANSSKKKNLVSSTPNLNAYQKEEDQDIEDDLFVSSATNSMHQLNIAQTQKPLGILLPAGSRTSFGKEVSFCPVVSKYSWQEQSSEEYHDDGDIVPEVAAGSEESDDELLDNCDAVVLKNTKENEIIGSLYKEETEEKEKLNKEHNFQPHNNEEREMKEKYKAVIKELPTLINNKQRETPEEGTLSKQEQQESKRVEPQQQQDSKRADPKQQQPQQLLAVVQTQQVSIANEKQVEQNGNGTQRNTEADDEDDNGSMFITKATFSLTTNVNNETLNVNKTDIKPPTTTQEKQEYEAESIKKQDKTKHVDRCENTIRQEEEPQVKPIKPTIVIARPISIQLPILSEPPINRAHHILYASQQMLDKFQRHQENESLQHTSASKSQSVQNLNRMSSQNNAATTMSSSSSTTKINNNNEIMKSKFKADEKHPNSKGFLSRFANGFRFSMRKNKKSKLNKDQQEQEQQPPETTESNKKINGTPIKIAKNSSKNQIKTVSSGAKNSQPDYIYIPLKGPLPEKYETGFFESHKESNGNAASSQQQQTTNGNALTNNNAVKQTNKKGAKPTKSKSNEEKVTGKPPLPPQQQQQLLAQKQQSANSAPQQQQQICTSRFYTHELQQTADSPPQPFSAHMAPLNPRGSTEDFLNAERSHAATQSFNNNASNHNMSASMNHHDFDGVSPSRATVSQKTQMFNNLSSRNSTAEPKIGLIETNLDTHETVITGKTRSLMNIGPNVSVTGSNKRHTMGGHNNANAGHHDDDVDYDDNDEVVVRPDGTVVVIKNAGSSATGNQQIASVRRPHKSMEFLLDKENQKDVMPPENELQKSHDHNPAALSEHQLRIQASLQRLNIPDWFRQYNQKSPDGSSVAGTYKPGNFTRKRTQDSGRWAGLNSKTTSLSSLGSQRSDRSPLLLSPSAHSHHGGQTASGTGHHGTVGGGHAGVMGHHVGGSGASGGAFSRWSTSHLNSSQTSPSVSQRGSFSRGGPINSSFISVNSGHSVIRNSMRQPYLGWRSQEKLSQRTAHERLASSLLSQQQPRTSPTSQTTPTSAGRKLQPVTPEIQSSIKEVTSAIVHYVNDQTNQQRSRSTSPNSRKCWLESSFVGIRPLDSPQTPVIESTPFIAAAAAASNNLRPVLQNNNSSNNNNSFHIANHQQFADNAAILTASAFLNSSAPLTGNDLQQLTRMNGGLNNGTTTTTSSSSVGGIGSGGGLQHYHPVGGATVNEHKQYMNQKQQQQSQQQQQHHQKETNTTLLGISKEEQQRLRRRSEGDAPTKQQKQQQQLQQQQQQQQQQLEQKFQHQTPNANKAHASDTITSLTHTHTSATGGNAANGGLNTFLPPRRVSLGDSSESNNRSAATGTINTASGELQVKCRNNKCDRTATPLDAKKYYKSCHNCTYLYCSRECRRAHWEKHRKACLHSRVSNLCRQVLASCKDDSDSLRHLSLLARKGFLSQGRGVVRILFRSPESAEGFIKNGFQCMGEASYVRWPDLMPAEMGLELYSELLKLSTEYRPDSKMLVYVAVCVVSEAPSVGQAPVRWERQLVSRCAKLKLCKTVLAELEQQPTGMLQQPVTMVAVPEPTTEVLILTFNPQLRNSTTQREMVLSNILDILSRRGVILRKHYPEIFQRFQSYTEGQTEKINPVTLHPRDSQTGQNFVCIIMPVQSDTEIIKLPSMADGGNRVTTIDVGSPSAISQLEDNELLTRTSMAANAS